MNSPLTLAVADAVPAMLSLTVRRWEGRRGLGTGNQGEDMEYRYDAPCGLYCGTRGRDDLPYLL